MAILTSHTVHIAVLPDSSHLGALDAGPIRVKTFQLGPTAHVLEQAPVVSALWHPLGHLGACLVTITKDACVRLWELNRESRHSFDEPAIALDLKKLANATSSDQDFKASKYGTSKGFSPDSVEMEVAAACFGGAASQEEYGWSSMTLWLVMDEGDVYALCPLLPSKWEPTATTIPALTTSVASRSAITQEDHATTTDLECLVVDQQHRWLTDVDSQDPLVISHSHTLEEFEVYNRPANPPAIPRLQGPFQLSPDPEYGQVTDIFVIAPRIDDDALLQEEDDDDFYDREGLSVGIICLATNTGKVHICLDLDGVEAEWLPSKKVRHAGYVPSASLSKLTFDQSGLQRRFAMEEQSTELVLIETIDIASTNASTAWPTFTRDNTSRYNFFISLPSGLYNISLNPWISSLEDELVSPTGSGAALRLDVLLETQQTEVSHILSRDAPNAPLSTPACISVLDSDLGHFILTSTSSTPQAAILDLPLQSSIYTTFAPSGTDQPLALPAPEPRQPYQPAPAFSASSSLPAFLADITASAQSRLKRTDLKTSIRFSPATLQLLTDAHRVLSSETSRLGAAAADLFRRCERMRVELAEQVRKVDEIASKIEAVTGDDDEGADADIDGARAVGKERIEQRMEAARRKEGDLHRRVEALRRRMAGLGGKELSAREEAWKSEVEAVRASLGDEEGADKTDATLTLRFEEVNALQYEMMAQVKEATSQHQTAEDGDVEELGASVGAVPLDFRKQKIGQVMALLERETALVDAVAERLGRLGGIGRSTSSLPRSMSSLL